MGPVIVGTLAIVASSIFNFLALRRSAQNLALAEGTARRVEERYQADRIEARRAQLISVLLDVSRVVNEWMTANARYTAAITVYATRMPTMNDSERLEGALEVQQVDMETQRPALAAAHGVLQMAAFLFMDTGGAVSDEHRALVNAQLDLVGKSLLKVQNAVNALNAGSPEALMAAAAEISALRREATKEVGDLVKLGSVVVAKASAKQPRDTTD